MVWPGICLTHSLFFYLEILHVFSTLTQKAFLKNNFPTKLNIFTTTFKVAVFIPGSKEGL